MAIYQKKVFIITLAFILLFATWAISGACTLTSNGSLAETTAANSTPVVSVLPSPASAFINDDTILHSNPPNNEISIGISPTVYGIKRQYYVPDNDVQTILANYMRDVDIDNTVQMETKDPLGISIVYKGIEWEFVSDGSIYNFDKGPKMRIAGLNDLCNYVLSLVNEEFGIKILQPTQIKDIIQAELSFSRHGDKETANQVIADPYKLKHLEDRLSNATIMLGGTGCPFEQALLTLKRIDGEIIQIRLASDSCQVYFHDGMFYDYDLDKNHLNSQDANETNEDVLSLFDEIPWN